MRGKRAREKRNRGIAAILSCALLFSVLPWTATTAQAADPTDYEAEKTARQEEYKKKFDLENLKWSANGEDANGKIVNYANSARNYLYWADGSFGGVNYKNYIHVFAFEGDTICFGSDVYNSQYNAEGTKNATDDEMKEIHERLGKDDATVDIVLTDLQGHRILYDVRQDGAGYIGDVQTEVLAKTMEDKTGNNAAKLKENFDVIVADGLAGNVYTPLTYQVTETGVYTLEFHSPAYTASGQVGDHRNGQTIKNGPSNNGGLYTGSGSHNALVAAWDVSVFNEQGHKETGRVYADYLSLQQSGSYNVIESYYVVTTDSYIYRWDWNGNRPNTYNFFADNKGLTDNATGSTLYKSVKELRNANFDYTRFGASFKYPGSVNTDESKSYYIFFEMPNSDLEGHLYRRAIQPDPAENIRFVDKVTLEDGSERPGAYVGMGGYFAFDTKEATTATLVLDFEQLKTSEGDEVKDGEGHTYAPVTISGPVKPYSTNYFYWDGRDGNGVVIPEGEYDIKDIITLTTKAGEIHFPVHDMEYAPGGFTFTRVSPIYDREGNQVDAEDNILGATKSVIYYDDTAIYYGEKVGRTGLTEKDVGDENGKVLRDTYPAYVINDKTGGTNSEYYKFNNMRDKDGSNNGGEYIVRNDLSEYVGGATQKEDGVKAEDFIRIGDHSHTTNTIEYYGTDGKFLSTSGAKYQEQVNKIKYLDSKEYPVAKIPTWQDRDDGTNLNHGSTTDYGISDFWTFIPAMPAVMEKEEQIIDIIAGDAFNLTGQVFYDKDSNGSYDPMKESDTLLSGVTLNLYRKATKWESGKTYYTVGSEEGTINPKDKIVNPHSVLKKFEGSSFGENTVYELYRTAVTPIEGRYLFTNIPYSKEGETFVYEVVRPNTSYQLTSGDTKASVHHATGSNVASSNSGSYALYAYDENAHGTEVQVITVGNGGIDPDNDLAEDHNHTVTAVDVGYHYDIYTKLTLKKIWSTGKAEAELPEPAVYEVRYVDSTGESHVYAEEPQTKIANLEYSYELLPESINGNTVRDWYVAAEYYFATVEGRTYLFKHTFAYDTNTGTYTSFVGDCKYIDAGDVDNNGTYDERDLQDRNADGETNWLDLADIPASEWQEAGTEGSVAAPYHAVLDRNPGSAEITIGITNTDQPGVIEILKYTGALEDRNYLQGATFRVYKTANISQVREWIEADKYEDLDSIQVDSNSTRANGKVAFAGLNPNEHYVLREMFPPTGYRAMDTLYLVHPKGNCGCSHIAELRTNTKPADMKDDEWEELTRQNFFFGADDFVQTPIANAPISGDMAIRKQIEGRAWNNNDSFSFDIAFRNGDGEVVESDSITDLTGLDFITLNDEVYGSNYEEVISSVQSFINAFNSKTEDITINNHSDPAKNIITLADGQNIEESLADTKQSVPLIVNGEIKPEDSGESTGEQHPVDALMNTSTTGSTGAADGGGAAPAQQSNTFPAAGTYTFTVSENGLDNAVTLESSARVFTVVVEVTRELDPDLEPSTGKTKENTYLRAEVKSISYQDPKDDATGTDYPADYGGRHVYAGVAPTFTNTYYVQPAIQTTSYAITKEFTGRLDENGQPINSVDGNEVNDGWLESDNFYVTITGADDATTQALTEGNIYIGGLHGKRDEEGNFATNKVVSFNQTNVTNPRDTTEAAPDSIVDEGHTFSFEEIDFQNLKFPVVWQFSTDNVPEGFTTGQAVPEEGGDGTNEVIIITAEQAESLEGIEAGNYFVLEVKPTYTSADLYPVEARTQDIVYRLEIKEYKPAGATEASHYTAAGVTYDEQVYTLVITLKNAIGATPDHLTEAVTDGIVDELDFALYACSNNEITDETKPVATCETDQKVVNTFDDWAKADFSGDEYNSDISGDKWTKKWYYVNNTGTTPVIREATVEEEEDGIPTKFSVMVPRAEGSGEQKVYIVGNGGMTEENTYTFETLNSSPAVDITFIAKREGHTGDHKMTIRNTYQAVGTWTPTVHKTVTGRDWEENEEFTFELACTEWPGMGEAASLDYSFNPLRQEDDGNVTAPAKKLTVKEDEETENEGTGSFNDIQFTAPGDYTFTLTESGKGKGLGKGKAEPSDITLKVKAEDLNDGTLRLNVTGESGTTPENTGDNTDDVDTTINFINAYDEEGSFEIDIAKTLTGRSWNADESFTFTVEPDEAAKNALKAESAILTLPENWIAKSDGTYTVTVTASDLAEATQTAKGTLKVGNLGTKGAIYVFTVTEDQSQFDEKNIYCRQPMIKLTVNVSSKKDESGYTGALLTYAYLDDAASEHIAEPYTVPFTNQYYVDTDDPATGIGDHGFTVAKSFTGRPGDAWESSDEFTVNIEYDDSASTGQLEDMFYRAPGETEYTEITDDKLTDGRFVQTVTFTSDDHSDKSFDFRFFAEGKYIFTVAESPGTTAGVDYDDSKYTVTFDVAQDTDSNTLRVTRTITGGVAENISGGKITIKNTYEAKGTWTPSVMKTLIGRSWQRGEEFAFTMSCSEKDGVDLPAETVIKVGEADAVTGVSFDPVTITRPGDYHFTIAETGEGSGLGKSSVMGAIEIKVKASDNGDGTLSLTVTGDGGTPPPSTIEKSVSEVSTGVTFNNTYSESGSFDLAIIKTLTGRDWTNDDSFTFSVKPDADAWEAIRDGVLIVPWKTSGADDVYTVEVTGTEKGTAAQTLTLGTLQVGGQNGEKKTYTFTVEEDTADFEKQHLYCAQPKATVTVTVTPKKEDNVFTGDYLYSATYAHLSEEDVPGTGTTVSGSPIAVPFTNRYYADGDPDSSGSSLTVGKNLEGREWLAGESYTVNMSLTGGTGKAEDVQYVQGEESSENPYSELSELGSPLAHTFTSEGGGADDPADWKMNFRFFEEGTYAFTVAEEEPAEPKPGVTCDPTQYTVTYTVKKDEGDGGRLKVSRAITPDGTAGKPAGSGADIVFVNTYETVGTWTPSVMKTLTGRSWQPDEAFAFTLALAEDSPVKEGVTLPSPAEIQVNEAQAQSGVSFGGVTLTKPGEYHFTITESSTGSGLGTGTKQGAVNLTVKAADDKAGHLNLTVTGEGGEALPDGTGDGSSDVYTAVRFVNAYSEGGEFAMSLSKLLTGRPWTPTDVFTFAIAPDEKAKEDIGTGTLIVPAAWGRPGADGSYAITVGGTDPGTLDSATGWTTKSLDMGTLQVGSLEAVRTSYTFTITEDTSAFNGDMYCSQPCVQLTVTAEPNLQTGQLGFSATYAYLDEDGMPEAPAGGVALPFVNHAPAEAVPDPVGSSLTVGKTISGRDWLAGEGYTAELKLESGDAGYVQYAEDGNYEELPASLTHEFKSVDGTAPGDWPLSFRFFAEGDYVFSVKEQTPSALRPGIACDDTKYTVTYSVKKQGDRLEVSRAVASDPEGREPVDDRIVFHNTYTPAAATWTPSVTKILNGREWAVHDSFSFVLALAEDSPSKDGVTIDGPNPVTIASSEDHTAAFGSVTFTQAGTYRFTISETGLEPGIVAGTYSITVTASDDTANGRLKLSFAPVSLAPEETDGGDGWHYATATRFVNTYSQQPGQFTLSIQKTLSGREWQEGESFTFTVAADEDTKEALSPGAGGASAAIEVPADWQETGDGVYTVTVADSGGMAADGVLTQTLGDVAVNQAGTYGFTIEEMEPEGGDTYCPEPVMRLTVRAMAVTDDEGTPTGEMLVTTFAYSGSGSAGHNAADGSTILPFVNYAYAGTELTLHKTFTDSTSGSEKDWSDGFFLAELTLESADGQVSYDGQPLTVGRALTVPLKKEGQSAPLRFLTAGSYVFTVEEVHGSAPGVTYDASVYTLHVTVTADEDTGVLTAAPEIVKDGNEPVGDIAFVNTYQEAPITGGLTVTKTVDDEDTSGTFHFTVTLSDPSVDGVYDGMTFHGGVAEFDLGHDGAVSASGLPAGVRYTVAEARSADYTASAAGASGRIPTSGTVTTAFVNRKGSVTPPPVDENSGSLTVVKTVSGITGETDRDWHFTVKLSDPDVSGTYGEMSFTGGEASFTLKHGHSIAARGLPAGLTYTVAEAEAGQDGYETKASGEKGEIPGGGAATVVFINHRDGKSAEPTGGLIVAKTVAGAEGDREREWSFSVKLSGEGAEDVNGSYDGVTFAGGEAGFALKHGQSKTFTDLPAGLDYTVAEAETGQDGYTTSAISAAGTIPENRTAAAVFTNTKNGEPVQPDHGFLTVAKTVTGNGGERDREFSFTLTLSEQLNGELGGVAFTDGVGAFTLKDGESVTFELPAGTIYTVTEEETADYTASFDGWTGTIDVGGTAVAAFANDRQISLGSLTVAKAVTGEKGDLSRKWHFHLELGDEPAEGETGGETIDGEPSGVIVDGEYGGVTITDGKADFTLRHGESVTITGLPAGIAYTVTEQEADQDGYTTSVVGSSGHIPADDTAFAEFVNECQPASPAPSEGKEGSGGTSGGGTPTGDKGAHSPGGSPDTGDHSRPGLWLLLLLLSLLTMTKTASTAFGKKRA